MAVSTQLMVGMADIKVTQGPATLTCLGLGSCIGLVAYDPRSEVCGMVHVMLPEAFKDKPVDKPGKFANTGIPALFEEMKKQGAEDRSYILAYGGGAQVFKYGQSGSSGLDVGARNAAAVAEHLKVTRSRVLATDVGGTSGRTIIVDTLSGQVTVRTVQGGEKVLCNLRG